MTDSIALPSIPDTELERTRRPEQPISEFVWDNDILRYVGSRNVDMTKALSHMTPETKTSFKNAAITFINKGDYAPLVYHGCFSIIATSLRQYASERFDDAWLAQAINSSSSEEI